MTTTPLRVLLEKAASDIETYRNPDITEARTWIDRILTAGSQPTIGFSEITCLTIGDVVHIEADFLGETEHHRFPSHLLDAEDPIRKARTWGLTQSLGDANREIDRAQSALQRAQVRREELTKLLMAEGS